MWGLAWGVVCSLQHQSGGLCEVWETLGQEGVSPEASAGWEEALCFRGCYLHALSSQKSILSHFPLVFSPARSLEKHWFVSKSFLPGVRFPTCQPPFLPTPVCASWSADTSSLENAGEGVTVGQPPPSLNPEGFPWR